MDILTNFMYFILGVLLIAVGVIAFALVYIIKWYRKPKGASDTFLVPKHLLDEIIKQDKKQQNFLKGQFDKQQRYLQESIKTQQKYLESSIQNQQGFLNDNFAKQQKYIESSIQNQQHFLTQNFNKQEQYLEKYYTVFKDDQQAVRKLLMDIQESYGIFAKQLKQKDDEIHRLKQGYDTAVHKKFVARYISVYLDIQKEYSNADTDENKQAYKHLMDCLKAALIESDVTIETPEIGKSFDDSKTILAPFKQQKTVPTADESQHHTIAHIVHPAFVLEEQERRPLLRGATVGLYVYEKPTTSATPDGTYTDKGVCV